MTNRHLVHTRPQAPRDPNAAMFEQGKGKRQQKKASNSTLWAKHDVDMHPRRYGKRKRLRDVSGGWGGKFIEMMKWKPGDFIKGEGLSRDGKFALYIQGSEVGRTDDWTTAKAYVRAAAHYKIQAEMFYNDSK